MTLTTSTAINGLNTEPTLGSWKLDTALLSVATQTTGPESLFFKSDGLQLYVGSYTGSAMWQYTLSSAWDVSTATFTRSFTGLNNPASGLWFKPDGLKMYTATAMNNGFITEYDLSVAWDISTLVFVQYFSVSSQDGGSESLVFNNTGTVLWILGNNNDRVYQYNLTTPWNVSTITYDNKSLFIGAGSNWGMNIDSTNKYVYIVENNFKNIYQYTLSTPGDISTGVASGQQHFAFTDVSPEAVWVEPTQNKAYIVGDSSNTIYQFTTNLPGFIVSSSSKTTQVIGDLELQNNFAVSGKTRLKSLTVGNAAGAAGDNQISAGAIFGSTINASGLITSTVGAGIMPLSIFSTSMVTNLNVNYLGGATFANPGPIGGTTKWAGNFTSLTITGSLSANGSIGTAGQSLLSNGTLAYWGNVPKVYINSGTPEVSAVTGDFWLNDSERALYVWNGTTWANTSYSRVTNRRVSASTTAANFDVIGVNTTTGPINITLPTPAFGTSIVTIYDDGCTAAFDGFATNNCTVLRNGSTIQGVADDILLATKGVSVIFEYNGTTWRMRNGG